MIRRPPRSTRTDTLFPYTTLFRSPLWRDRILAHLSDVRLAMLVGTYAQAAVLGRGRMSHRVRDYRQYLPSLFPLPHPSRSEEHTSELQSLMRISYAVFCLKKKKNIKLVQS